MESLILYVADLLWDWPLIVAILSTGLYFTVASGFFQIKHFRHIVKNTICGVASSDERSGNTPKAVETFYTAVATTAGVGNITGVATAITFGGPGALFWMIVTGFVGMIIKMAEVSLAVYYRDENEDGSYESSPMHYIEKGIGVSMNFETMKVPILVFAVGILATIPFNIQNYYASMSFESVRFISFQSVTIFYALVLYIMIFKGIGTYGKVIKFIVPTIIIIYVGSGGIVLVRNSSLIIPAVKWILSDAFHIGSFAGGIAGQGVAEIVRQGFSRAIYSNEAGWGTTPMLHAKAGTDHPIKIGLWGVTEVFVDTVVICFISGVVVVIALVSGSTSVGLELVIEAFSMGIGKFANILVPVTMLIFGLTTSLGWYSYYETVLRFIGTRSNLNVLPIINSLKFTYPLPGILSTLYFVRSGAPSSLMWALSEVVTGLPTFINIFSVLVLSNKFFDLLQDYERKYIKGIESDEEIPLFFKEENRDYFVS